MGGNGSVSSLTGTIPIEKRAFHRIDTIDGIKVLEHNTLGNAKTPVECNTPNSVYAIYSKKAGIIKHVLFFDGHYLKRSIDFNRQGESHAHKWSVDENGDTGRIPHESRNTFALTKKEQSIAKEILKWNRSRTK